MSRAIAIPFALLVGWSLYCVVWAQEPPSRAAPLPPSTSVSAAEVEIENRLTWPVMLEFQEETLQDVVHRIAESQGIDTQLDSKALADAAVDPTSLVTFRMRRALPLADALDLMLDDFNLTYVIQYGVLRITSKEKADGVVTFRVYPVDDLVNINANVPSYMPPAKSSANFGPLIQMIEDIIAPDSWDSNSGSGSIKPYRGPNGLALVVSNRYQVHLKIAALLADLRAMRQLPGRASQPQPQRVSQTLSTKSYDLGSDSGPDMVYVIVSSVTPSAWQGKGGAGLIWAKPKDGGGKPKSFPSGDPVISPAAAGWTLVVSQTPDVHQQIADMLAHRNAPGPRKGAISGLPDPTAAATVSSSVSKLVELKGPAIHILSFALVGVSPMIRGILVAVAFVVCSSPVRSLAADEPAAEPLTLPPAVGQTPAEAEIEAALRQMVTLDIKEKSLADAADEIGKQVGIDVRLDLKGLADAAIDPAVLVTYKNAKPKPFAYTLDWLNDFDLAYVVSRDALQITSKERADSLLATRVYPVDDLAPDRDRGPSRVNSSDGQKLIRTPSGWALVLSGNRQNHDGIAQLLAEIRATKDPRHSGPDAEIEAALRKRVTLVIEGESLADAVDRISAQTGLELWLDHRAMADAAIDPSARVTFKNRKPVSLGAALEHMLEDCELTYVIRHGRVQITSKEKADNMHVWRAYPVSDLVDALPGREPSLGPIIHMIEDIAPDSWDTNSGISSVQPFHAPWGWLIVFPNTRVVHAQVAALLAELRQLKQASGAAPPTPRDPQARYLEVYYLGAPAGAETIKMLTEAISPESWQANGGAGKIWSVPITVTPDEAATKNKAADQIETRRTMLVVSQTDAVHRQLGEFIATLAGRNSRSFGTGGFGAVIETVPPIATSAPLKSDETPSANQAPQPKESSRRQR